MYDKTYDMTAELRKIATCGLHVNYTATCRACRDRFVTAVIGYDLGRADGRADGRAVKSTEAPKTGENGR